MCFSLLPQYSGHLCLTEPDCHCRNEWRFTAQGLFLLEFWPSGIAITYVCVCAYVRLCVCQSRAFPRFYAILSLSTRSLTTYSRKDLQIWTTYASLHY